MITDKDRAELKELTNQIRKSNQPMQWFDYGWDDCAEIIMCYVEKKNAESAEQERKKAAERVSSAWREHGADITLRTIRAAILGDSVVKENLITDQIPDTWKKLAIAVKALEVIRDNALNPAHTMTTLGLEQVTDANRAISDRALKEIQGRA